MHRHQPPAFTLIELLVVVSILAILLAILAPAMDKAVYYAQLASCGSNEHQSVGGLSVYAMDHGRSYPWMRMTGNDTPEQLMRNGVTGANDPGIVSNTSNTDLRPSLKGYVDLGLLLDPLAGKVDLSTSASNRVYMPYALWTGFTILGESRGMKRLGDRLTYSGREFPGQRPAQLDIVLGDWAEWSQGNAFIRCSHPDGQEQMGIQALQDDPNGSYSVGGVNNGGPYTETYWLNYFTAYVPGPFDLNFAHSDGSVSRLNALNTEDDPRTIKMPDWPARADGTAQTRGSVLPLR